MFYLQPKLKYLREKKYVIDKKGQKLLYRWKPKCMMNTMKSVNFLTNHLMSYFALVLSLIVSFVFSVIWYDDCLLFFEALLKFVSCCAVMKHQKKYCQMLLVRYFRNKKKASKNEEKVKEEPFKSMVASYGLIDFSE